MVGLLLLASALADEPARPQAVPQPGYAECPEAFGVDPGDPVPWVFARGESACGFVAIPPSQAAAALEWRAYALDLEAQRGLLLAEREVLSARVLAAETKKPRPWLWATVGAGSVLATGWVVSQAWR